MSSLRLRRCIAILGGAIMLFAGGCITKRTVTDGGSVVEQRYYFKNPFSKTSAD